MNQDNLQNNTQKENPFKADIKKSVQERINQYIEQESAIIDYLKQNPSAPQQQREADKKYIVAEVAKLESVFNAITPYILKIRERISNILDQNKLTASYFLCGKIFQSWRALFLLAREGFHYEVVEILRSIKESEDLMFFFLYSDASNLDLKKWFAGKIISNEKARAAMHDFANKASNKVGMALPVDKLKSNLYSILSGYIHVSYGALLDSFNVFSRDFDFDNTAGFHYMRESSLPYAHTEMHSLIIVLKYFYQSADDNDSYGKLDSLLRKIAPEMYDIDKIRQAAQKVKSD